MNLQDKVLINLLECRVELKNKDILEVGGGRHLSAPKILAEKGCRSVLVTNVGHGLEEQDYGVIRTKIHSALEISNLGKYFDIIYGVAVLEHIPDTEMLMREVYNCLKPGGVAYFSGGPLWSSLRGHHCWISINDLSFQFTDRDIVKIIEPFDHILKSEYELRENLAVKLGRDTAEELSHHVYHSPHINRLSHGKIMNAIFHSGLSIVRLTNNIYSNEVIAERARLVEEILDDGTDPNVMGFEVVLKKPF